LSEGEERVEEAEEQAETSEVEAIEEAPADFVVDVDALEVMLRVSDLLVEAARSATGISKYIEEIESIQSGVVVGGRRKVKRVGGEGKKPTKEEKPKAKSRKKRGKGGSTS
jgi:hypothetical protein